MGRFDERLRRFDEGKWAPSWLRRAGKPLAAGYESFPDGLDLVADPALAEEIRTKAWPRRMWFAPPIVVPADDFVDPQEAKRIAGVRTVGGASLLAARGILRHCYRATDGAEGYTRTSAEAERRWKDGSTRWQRTKRRLAGILHWV